MTYMQEYDDQLLCTRNVFKFKTTVDSQSSNVCNHNARHWIHINIQMINILFLCFTGRFNTQNIGQPDLRMNNISSTTVD